MTRGAQGRGEPEFGFRVRRGVGPVAAEEARQEEAGERQGVVPVGRAIRPEALSPFRGTVTSQPGRGSAGLGFVYCRDQSPPPGFPNIPGIMWCQNVGLQWFWFAPNLTFGEVLGALQGSGFLRTPDPSNSHPGQVSLRSPDPICSYHLLIDPPQGDLPGESSGEAHIDTINPASPYSIPLAGVVPALGHLGIDVLSNAPGRGCSSFPPWICSSP